MKLICEKLFFKFNINFFNIDKIRLNLNKKNAFARQERPCINDSFARPAHKLHSDPYQNTGWNTNCFVLMIDVKHQKNLDNKGL